VVYTAGCGYKCPFCNERDLVFIPDKFEYLDPAGVVEFLKKRQGLLDAVCVSGGEPLAQKDIEPFLNEIKNLGYPVKLDTNGAYPAKLKALVEDGLIDYVAMDVKNTPEKYAETCGMNLEAFDFSRIEESIAYLKEGHVPYEFVTTVVRQFHTAEDIGKIAQWLGDGSNYYLQAFNASGKLMQDDLSGYGFEEMKAIAAYASKFGTTVMLRGMED
jgi:anaerobic ribonucleoside-triphosphate reductase activating protein